MGVSIRRPRVDDVPEIEDIAKKYDFDIPSKFVTAAVAEKDDKILAFGALRVHLEAILICDGRDREKIEAIRSLVQRAINDARDLGFEQVHVFVTDNSFSEILQKKFEFRPAIGQTLVLDI